MQPGLRVVHIDFSRDWRGGQQQLLLLAQGLRALGCDNLVVARPGPVLQRYAAAGLPVLAPGPAARRQVRAAAIVHAHDGRAHSWLLWAAWRQRARRVLSRRVAFPLHGPAARWKYHRLDLVIAVSQFVAAQVRAAGVPAARLRVIPDAIALPVLPDPAAVRARLRLQWGWDDPQPCLVCVGALTPEKGVADALAVLARLPSTWRLLLPGEGPLLPALRRQAQALGCTPRVHFAAGACSPAEAVAAADILLMPSHQEGLGSAALLAMALRRPVVATRTGGIPELVQDGASGLLAAPADVPALAAACARLHQDSALTRRLTTTAATNLDSRHAVTIIAAATLEAYQQLLA